MNDFIFVVLSKDIPEPLDVCKTYQKAYRSMNKFKKSNWKGLNIQKWKVF